METAVIVDAVRTPIGRKKGSLASMRPDDMAAFVLKSVVARAKIDPSEVNDVVMGCVTQIGEQGFNIARNAALIAGFPVEVTGTSVNRQCGSSLQAINFAAQGIMSGMQDCVIGAGVESMSRVPMGIDGMGEIGGSAISPKLSERFDIVPQGISAEMVAEEWKLTRAEIDAFSYESHRRAIVAIEKGYFKNEIVPIETTDNGGNKALFDTDECPRRDTTLEKLGTLRTVFKDDGVVTAGSSSQISDGASAVLLMSETKAKALGLKPRAKIKAMALAGVSPTIMLTGVMPATRKALAIAGLTIKDIGAIEINEAFATVVLAWEREIKPDMKVVNPNGGAIALGHPLGCSGARLLTTLLNDMERRDVKYGLATLCIGFGQAIATIIERY